MGTPRWGKTALGWACLSLTHCLTLNTALHSSLSLPYLDNEETKLASWLPSPVLEQACPEARSPQWLQSTGGKGSASIW